ncbi:hypothetical protein AIIKEEIJ_03429 [Rhodococcus sp. YH1]|nr:hypothetical protein [Rhodococcus sp. YH1]
MSRASVQPPSGPGSVVIFPFLPARSRPSPTAFCAAVHRRDDDIASEAAFIAAASTPNGACSTFWCRSSTSSDGMSILTGHASKHAPHRLDANGRVALGSPGVSMPASCGLSTAPIGPGYVEP